jgi:hypothetical protein
MSDGVHQTYRSVALGVLGSAGGVLGVVMAVWVLVDEAGRGQWLQALAAALWAVLLGMLVVEVFLRPAVSTTPEGVVLVNPFRTVVVPWAAVRGVETEYALQILTVGRSRASWAATGRRGPSRLLRGQRASDQVGPPSMAALIRGSGSPDGIAPPAECKMFIEAGLGQWRESIARAAASARAAEPGAVAPATVADTTGRQEPEPSALDGAGSGAPRVTWHRRWVLAIAVTAALLLAVTLAM